MLNANRTTKNGGWFLPPTGHPLSEDLCVDLLSIFSVLVFYAVDSISIRVIQEEDTKLAVIVTVLSWNVDCSTPPLESDAF